MTAFARGKGYNLGDCADVDGSENVWVDTVAIAVLLLHLRFEQVRVDAQDDQIRAASEDPVSHIEDLVSV